MDRVRKQTIDKICRNKKVNMVLIVLISLWLVLDLYHTTEGIMQGDSGIYFTFCKNFFKQPFSYANGNVSYGASSPLFCFLNSIVYHLSSAHWFFMVKLFSISLLVVGILIINFTVKGNVVTYIGLVAGLFTCGSVIFYTSAVFETGLICLVIAALIYFAIRGKFLSCIYITGLFYLVRPELIIATAGIDLLILILEKEKKRNMMHMFFSFIPLSAYTVYMTFLTGYIFPSSISGRVATAKEMDYSIQEKWKICLQSLKSEYSSIFQYIILFVSFCIFAGVAFYWHKNYIYIVTLFVLIFVPHILLPSVNHAVRYTIAIVPILLAVLGFFINMLLRQKGVLRFFIIVLFCTAMFWSERNTFKNINTSVYSQEKFDILFGKDLREALRKIGISKGTMLMYEIQQQYYLEDFQGISLDAIVGSEMEDYLQGREKLSDVVLRENIDYIVCHQSALTRPVFANTEIQQLYRKGRQILVGQSITIDNIVYKKILDNQAQTHPYELYNVPYIPEDELVVYAEGEPWQGGTLFWQTVYEVVR